MQPTKQTDPLLIKFNVEEREITRKIATAHSIPEAQIIRAAIRLAMRNEKLLLKEATK